MSKREKDLPSPTGEGKVCSMPEHTHKVSKDGWDYEWTPVGPSSPEHDDLHYDRYGNIIKENNSHEQRTRGKIFALTNW